MPSSGVESLEPVSEFCVTGTNGVVDSGLFAGSTSGLLPAELPNSYLLLGVEKVTPFP